MPNVLESSHHGAPVIIDPGGEDSTPKFLFFYLKLIFFFFHPIYNLFPFSEYFFLFFLQKVFKFLFFSIEFFFFPSSNLVLTFRRFHSIYNLASSSCFALSSFSLFNVLLRLTLPLDLFFLLSFTLATHLFFYLFDIRVFNLS